ncbi:hypothetical protein GC093_16195 [Paenibacillus sp. LMG 31456]|uniref:Uncharacterized protein n=1 Tax=Paenibacillus foliorum TaxID=2654974 RepID=A0A972JZM7_9BACL|nr:hypothetical protein [Paenibacillus foliorum]NOU94749.1 hypothetical protein [Paenibacillus foliorum]
MRYTATLFCTALGAALCLMHYIGHDSDPIYLIFYALSVPAWFYAIFTYTNVNAALLYFLTIVSWAIIGYAIDRFTVRKRTRSH